MPQPPMLQQQMPQPPMLQQQMPLLPSPVKYSRGNLADLKSQIVKRLGQDRAQRYFSYLNGLLSLKISKREFSKLCLLTLGPGNLPLHNQFIRLIFQNACQAKTPPPFHRDKFSQMSTGIGLNKSPRVDNGLVFTQASKSVPQACSNGAILQQLPRMFRSGIDSFSIKGPGEKVQVAACQPMMLSDEVVPDENDELSKSMQEQWHVNHEHLAKRARITETSPHNQASLDNNIFAEITPLHHNIDNSGDMKSFRSSLRAPLGIPFCLASKGGAKKSLLPSCAIGTSFCSSYDCSELNPTEFLKMRIEKMAEAQGLEGVTMDCANLLNNGLDVYLKRLIRSCVQIVEVRTCHLSINQPIPDHVAKSKNGVCAGSNTQMRRRIGPLEGIHVVSMQDFKVAMEVNPLQLGEDWPLLLEKIGVRVFEG